jgi:hypothetical protein
MFSWFSKFMFVELRQIEEPSAIMIPHTFRNYSRGAVSRRNNLNGIITVE